MPIFASWLPRTMFPPPMTSPTAAPSVVTWTTSSHSRFIVSKSNPNPLSPASASPDSLMRTRGYLSSVMKKVWEFRRLGVWALYLSPKPPNTQTLKRRSRLAHLEAREPAHLDVLAGLAGHFFHEISDGLLVVADPGLAEQRHVLVERFYLAL